MIFNGKNNYESCDVPQRLSREISHNIEIQFWQVLELRGLIVTIVLSMNTVFLLFSLKWKRKHKSPSDISQSHFRGHIRPTYSIFKCITSNCCLVFILTSARGALWRSCMCRDTSWKHVFSSEPLEMEPAATHFKTFTKTSNNWNKESLNYQPSAFCLSGRLGADSSWFLSPFYNWKQL